MDANFLSQQSPLFSVPNPRTISDSADSVVAFGDGYSDESMMRVAGFSISIGNSVDQIKACVDYIAETNHNDGVALAVERLLL